MDRAVAIVTGGTGGIGSAISRTLSATHRVIACYFKHGNHEEAKEWQKIQRLDGFDIDIAYADIVQFDACEAMIRQILAEHGRIDVLVNNAGITHDGSLRKMLPEAWHEVIEANLTSVYNMTHHVLPSMIEKQFGRIVSIASINGRKGQFGQCNYAASKAALYGFSKSLALEVASKGITVNTISPGYIHTHMLDHVPTAVLKDIVGHIPVGRLGKPEEIAAAVAFLVSSDSGFITGTNLDVNGGQYM